jgi:hypothetical protein
MSAHAPAGVSQHPQYVDDVTLELLPADMAWAEGADCIPAHLLIRRL